MGGAIGGIAKNIQPVVGGLNITPIMQQAMQTIAEAGDQRAAFNALLLATAANVSKKPNFNLELEINDLFIRLGNLRGMGASSGPFGLPMQKMASQIQSQMQQMSSMTKDMENAISNLVKSLATK